MLFRIANSEDPDLGPHWLFRPRWQATSGHNFRTSPVSTFFNVCLHGLVVIELILLKALQ